MTPAATAFRVRPEPPRRLSMSFLRAAEGCLRRAHMDRTAGIPSDGDALTGSLFHECMATIGFVATMRGVPRIAPDDAVTIARMVLRRPDEDGGPLPRESHRTVIELVDRWARRPSEDFMPGEQFEILSEKPLGRYLLSARIDRRWRDGSTVRIRDYKSGWGDPARALTMQGEVYAWHAFEDDPQVEVVDYAEDHARFGVPNGPYEITRDDVYGPGGIEEFLRDALALLHDAYQEGKLPATPGSACSSPSRCPHAKTCPIPEWARLTTAVETEQHARTVFGSLLVQEQRRAADTKTLRGWLQAAGLRALTLNGQEIGVAERGGRALNKKRLAADLAAGVEVTDLDAYMEPTNPTFGRRKAL